MKYAEKRFYTNPGNPIHVVYSPVVAKDGSVDLKESGFENTNEFIQSFKESTDLHTILTRIQMGETELLQKRTGSFGDFTKMPKTYAEALQLQIDSNNLFNSLPIEIKQKFNNDPNQFFAQSGNKEWFEKLEPVLPDEVKSTLFPSVKPDEVNEEVKE